MRHDNRKLIGSSDEHYTPPWVFEKLGLTFDLDVCAPKGGINYIPAQHHYCLEDDSLTQNWFGRVWMNPPYSKPTPWVDKFIKHSNGIALVPVTRGMWFDRIWSAADAICLDIYNNKFVLPSGLTKAITFRTMFVAIGKDNAEALHRLKIGKVR
jgi:hypothetical protein